MYLDVPKNKLLFSEKYSWQSYPGEYISTLTSWRVSSSAHLQSACWSSADTHQYLEAFWLRQKVSWKADWRVSWQETRQVCCQPQSSWNQHVPGESFLFDKSAFFQSKTFCQNIPAHFCCIFIFITPCPDGKIWLLRLAQISHPSLQARCWTCLSPIPSPWAMPIGCDIGKILLCSFSVPFTLPCYNIICRKSTQGVFCTLTMFMSLCVREQRLGVVFVYCL